MIKQLLVVLVSFSLISCGQESGQSGSSTTMAPASGEMDNSVAEVIPCPSDAGITYICGLMNAEDLLSVGDTGMILTSGMSGEGVNGHLYLVNPLVDTWEELTTGPNYSEDQDSSMFPNCPGPLDLSNFSAHGLALKETDSNRFDLYITSHGAREGIEVFDLDLSEGVAELAWKGCVELEAEVMHNSVAILNDGGFVTTEFMRWNDGLEAVFGEPNGGVKIWRPGTEASLIEGTMLSGPNGIAVSEDNETMYVAAFGSREVVKFDLTQNPPAKESVQLEIVLDNIRWGEPGKLLTAGGNADNNGWAVVEVDAETLEVRNVGGMDSTASMQGISSALQVGDEIWVGTYGGDRIGYFEKQ